MDENDLSSQQPQNIDEAVSCMRTTLEHFHRKRDKRAIFLRVYYIMTLEVHAAIHQLGEYAGTTVFIDPDWVFLLSGKFSSLYFTSLATFDRPDCEKAWKTAYEVATSPGSTVVENAVLGINAHINYDLPRAIARNLAPSDLDSYTIMQRRKFDHDQVNNLLIRVLDPIQDVLARDYEPGIAIADDLMGSLDERMSEFALKYYRERVWWDGLAFAAAMRNGTDDIVRDKLNWESGKLADTLVSPQLLWTAERMLNQMVFWKGTKSWAGLPLEQVGGTPLKPPSERRRATAFVGPNPRRLLARAPLTRRRPEDGELGYSRTAA